MPFRRPPADCPTSRRSSTSRFERGVPTGDQRRVDAVARADRQPRHHRAARTASARRPRWSRCDVGAPARSQRPRDLARDAERFGADGRRASICGCSRDGSWFSPLRAGARRLCRQDPGARHRRRPAEAVQGRLHRRRMRTVAPASRRRQRRGRRLHRLPTDNDWRLMTTLWSGRFDAAPDAAAFEWGSSFRFDRRLFEDDVTGSLAWARALAAPACCRRTKRGRSRRRSPTILEQRPRRSGVRRRPRRRRAQLRRAAAGRAARRRRQAAAHRPVAQRAGVARPAAVPAPAHSAAAARASRGVVDALARAGARRPATR